MSHSLNTDAARLSVSGAGLSSDATISVLLAGRRIWSFRVAAAQVRRGESFFTIDWPPGVAERLDGRATISIVKDGVTIVAPTEVAFGDSDAVVTLDDPVTGLPLVVNKWGRIAPTFAGRQESFLDDLLDEAETLERFVRTRLGVSMFVTGGTLLGPVRDGRIMPGDDDVDFAYLSEHDNPSDVVLESLRMERALVDAGYEIVRLSGGHLQLMFPGGAISDRFYIDIFSYFVCNNWFYGTFHARERASRVTLLPLVPLDVNGRSLPAPAQPEQLLAAIYGAHWRTPDPAFTFETPPAALRRFRGWLDDVNMDRENWEDDHRSEIAQGGGDVASEFAEATALRLPAGGRVIELGCGLGADARFLASLGHEVLAVDYSRPALAFAAAAARSATARSLSAPTGAAPSATREPPRVRFERVNLNLDRDALRVLDDAIAGSGPVTVYGRSLFDALSEPATGVTLRLLRQLLRHPESRGFFEFERGGEARGRQWTDYGDVDLDGLIAAAARTGLSVAEHRRGYENADGERTGDRIVLRREQA
jgi:SAM-dependent methyltransferase